MSYPVRILASSAKEPFHAPDLDLHRSADRPVPVEPQCARASRFRARLGLCALRPGATGGLCGRSLGAGAVASPPGARRSAPARWPPAGTCVSGCSCGCTPGCAAAASNGSRSRRTTCGRSTWRIARSRAWPCPARRTRTTARAPESSRRSSAGAARARRPAAAVDRSGARRRRLRGRQPRGDEPPRQPRQGHARPRRGGRDRGPPRGRAGGRPGRRPRRCRMGPRRGALQLRRADGACRSLPAADAGAAAEPAAAVQSGAGAAGLRQPPVPEGRLEPAHRRVRDAAARCRESSRVQEPVPLVAAAGHRIGPRRAHGGGRLGVEDACAPIRA